MLVVYCVAPDSVVSLVCGLVVHVWQLTIAADVLGVGQAWGNSFIKSRAPIRDAT